MSESFVWEFVDLLSDFFFYEVANNLFPCCVVWEREVYLFVEQFLAFFQRGVEGLVAASNDSDSIILCPKLVLLHVCDDLFHLGAESCSSIFFLGLYSAEDSLKVINHDNRRLVLLGTDDD